MKGRGAQSQANAVRAQLEQLYDWDTGVEDQEAPLLSQSQVGGVRPAPLVRADSTRRGAGGMSTAGCKRAPTFCVNGTPHACWLTPRRCQCVHVCAHAWYALHMLRLCMHACLHSTACQLHSEAQVAASHALQQHQQ